MEANSITHLRFREQGKLGIHLIGVRFSLHKQIGIKHTSLKGKAPICMKRGCKYLQFDVHDLTWDLPWEIVQLHVLLSHLVGRCLHLKSRATD